MSAAGAGRTTLALGRRQAGLAALSGRLGRIGVTGRAAADVLRALAISPDAPAVQLNEMRMAYMAGAQHLFASIISLLDEGQESTESDLRRMDLISAELDAYRRELEWRSWW